MSGPDLTEAEINAVSEVLRTPGLSLGPRLREFEDTFAAYVGSKYAVGVSSGTAGLHVAAVAAGIGEGDLVITTSFSFVASANCLLYQRAVPVFVDIDPQSFNIDPFLVEAAACDLRDGTAAGSRWLPPALQESEIGHGYLKGVLPVDVFGQPVDIEPILRVARSLDLVVIEDACEAVGAEYKGHNTGTLGDVAVFAFYPNKQITTGEGGIIVTDREDWAALFRSLRNQGRDVFNEWLEHSRLGYNYRLDEMSAALGLAQLNRVEELLAKRDRVATWYDDRLSGIDGVSVPYIAPTTTRMSWFVYVVRLAAEIDRSRVMELLDERGVPSRPYFVPIHLQPFYRERFGYREGDFPVTETVGRSTLALPFYGNLSEREVDYVCTALKDSIP
jgi:perosamine synthetase